MTRQLVQLQTHSKLLHLLCWACCTQNRFLAPVGVRVRLRRLSSGRYGKKRGSQCAESSLDILQAGGHRLRGCGAEGVRVQALQLLGVLQAPKRYALHRIRPGAPLLASGRHGTLLQPLVARERWIALAGLAGRPSPNTINPTCAAANNLLQKGTLSDPGWSEPSLVRRNQ